MVEVPKTLLNRALFAGATGAVAGGIKGAMTPGVGFMKGMSAAVNPANFSARLYRILGTAYVWR